MLYFLSSFLSSSDQASKIEATRSDTKVISKAMVRMKYKRLSLMEEAIFSFAPKLHARFGKNCMRRTLWTCRGAIFLPNRHSLKIDLPGFLPKSSHPVFSFWQFCVSATSSNLSCQPSHFRASYYKNHMIGTKDIVVGQWIPTLQRHS